MGPQCGAGRMSHFRRLEFRGDFHFFKTLWTDGLQDTSCSVDEISLAENPIQRCGFV